MHFCTLSLHWKRCRSWDKKIPRGYQGGGGVGGVLRISRDRSLELLFQRLLSIVYTTLLIQSQFDYSVLSGVIVEKLFLTGYRSFTTVLLVF